MIAGRGRGVHEKFQIIDLPKYLKTYKYLLISV